MTTAEFLQLKSDFY